MADKPGRQWKRSDGVVISDEGKNDVPCCFSSTGEADDHFCDHSVDYPGLTQEQYTKKAADLASSEADGNIIGFSTDDGCIVRYDKQNNDYVKAYPGKEGCVITLFKPDSRAVYYHNDKKETWKYRKVK